MPEGGKEEHYAAPRHDYGDGFGAEGVAGGVPEVRAGDGDGGAVGGGVGVEGDHYCLWF